MITDSGPISYLTLSREHPVFVTFGCLITMVGVF